MKKILLLLLLLITFSNINASPYNGEIKSFKQPDGSMVDLKLYGTEYYMRAEGLDGYTLIRDLQTNYICYAALSKDKKNLTSTGIVYHGNKNDISTLNNNLAFEKHLDVTNEAREAIIANNMKMLGFKKETTATGNSSAQKTAMTPIGLVSGNIKGLCIVVDFSDQPGTLPLSEFDHFCNDLNYTNFGNNGSLRTFYRDVSGGLVDYQNVIYGYFRAPKTFAQYDAMPYAQGAMEILGLALNWIDGTGFDFSTLSINPDGTIQAINLMYTGVPPNWAQGMWHHKGWYTSFSADGVTSNDYNCSPANDPLELAVVAHENGHMIGKWPDTYKYGSTTGPDGIGAFDLMCWYGDSHNPVPPNPLFRSNAGWGKVVDVTGYNGWNVDTANSRTCYKYKNVNDTNEFFLFENRMKVGRSQYIPDQGLAVWHVDRHGDNQTLHHEIALVPSSNNFTSQAAACYRGPIKTVYSSTTTPNSNFYNGDPSGLMIWQIGNATTNLNYRLGLGNAGQALNVLYNNFTDNNGNNSLGVAEQFTVNVSALNLGQLNSANATFKCTAVGSNANYVIVNTSPYNLGVINASQNIPKNFNVTTDPSTPIGTEITLKFNITDGVDSLYITKKFIIGEAIVLNNTNSTTCGGIFFDAGFTSNYSDNENFTKTFYPSTTGAHISAAFSEFNVEFEANCGYDYLKIYNGPSTANALLGTYCGTNTPGTIVSTHSSGALTFKFHSDEGYSEAGWQAIISCYNPTGLTDLTSGIYFNLSPNPTTGIFNCNFSQPVNAEITVVDLLGKEILTKQINSESRCVLDLSSNSNGIYFVKLNINGNVTTNKLIISH